MIAARNGHAADLVDLLLDRSPDHLFLKNNEHVCAVQLARAGGFDRDVHTLSEAVHRTRLLRNAPPSVHLLLMSDAVDQLSQR